MHGLTQQEESLTCHRRATADENVAPTVTSRSVEAIRRIVLLDSLPRRRVMVGRWNYPKGSARTAAIADFRTAPGAVSGFARCAKAAAQFTRTNWRGSGDR